MTFVLSFDYINLIKNSDQVVFATSDSNNQPRAIIVQPSKIDQNGIILSNIQMNKTIENIKCNNKCFLNVYCKDNSDMQLKITGTATIYKDGILYNEIKNYEEKNNLPNELKVHSIIVIKPEYIEVSQE